MNRLWHVNPAALLARCLAVGLAGAALGCAAVRQGTPSQQVVVPVSRLMQRVEFPGFSVEPPRGEHWFLEVPTTSSPSELVFRKQLRPEPPTRPAEAHTVFARVEWSVLDQPLRNRAELLQWVAQSLREGFSPSDRLHPVWLRTSPDGTPGADCLRYDFEVEDVGVPWFPGVPFLYDGHGLSCIDPEIPSVILDAAYSQRWLKGEARLPLGSEGEAFLKSLRFHGTPMPSPGAESKPVRAWYEEPAGFAIALPLTWWVIADPRELLAEPSMPPEQRQAVQAMAARFSTLARAHNLTVHLVGQEVSEAAVPRGAALLLLSRPAWHVSTPERFAKAVLTWTRERPVAIGPMQHRRVSLPAGEAEDIALLWRAPSDRLLAIRTYWLLQDEVAYELSLAVEADHAEGYETVLMGIAETLRFPPP